MPRWTPLMPLLLWSLSAVSLHAEVQFVSTPLPIVKDMAANQGKLYFVHFTAQWCMPCRWMEEHTFSDPALSGYVSEYYIAVKMDIDDSYGLKYKEEYSVQLLPTILIFNSKGELIDRKEASLAPDAFLQILRQHNQSQPRPSQRPAGATSPVYPQAPQARPESLSPGSLSRPALVPEEMPLAQPTIVAAASYSSAPAASAPLPAPDDSTPFTVQTGVYSDYSNALNEVSRLESLLRRPVSLTATPQNGKAVYKITVGNFSSRLSAENYLVFLRGKSVSGFVRHIDGE